MAKAPKLKVRKPPKQPSDGKESVLEVDLTTRARRVIRTEPGESPAPGAIRAHKGQRKGKPQRVVFDGRPLRPPIWAVRP